MPGAVATVGLLATLLASCGSGGPTPADIKRRLDAHVEQVFAGVVTDDAAQLAADKQRVRDMHAIAALVEDYKKRSGRYPMVSADGALKQVFIAPGRRRIATRPSSSSTPSPATSRPSSAPASAFPSTPTATPAV